jgi:hypothetical protein
MLQLLMVKWQIFVPKWSKIIQVFVALWSSFANESAFIWMNGNK